MVNRTDLIISLTAGLKEAGTRAQAQADKTGEAFGVWEHVGLYGHPHGDIPARHTFRTQAMSKPDPDNAWALVAWVGPTVPTTEASDLLLGQGRR